MRTKKIGLLFLACIVIVLTAMELHWRRGKFKQIESSPSGHRVAAARAIYDGLGTEVLIWPSGMRWPGIGAFRAFSAPCAGKIAWKNDGELQIICPNPEGNPIIRSPTWSVTIVYDETVKH